MRKGIFNNNKASQKLKEQPSQVSSASNKNKNKKGKSPFKKFKSIFKKKSKKPIIINNKENESITLVSPEVSKESTQYYSNNTDGFEIILEGKQVMYEENLNKHETRTNSNLCGATEVSDTCDPLLDWNNFVNLLMPNINGFFDIVYGEGEASPPNPTTKKKAVVQKPPVPRIITQKSSLSMPFDESFERSAIETTLEDGPSASLAQQPLKGEETVEIHPYKKVNDGPIHKLRKAAEDSDQDSLAEWEGDAPPQDAEPAAIAVPPVFAPKADVDVPDEEVYDTIFTLKFLKEVSNIGIMLTYFQVPEDGQEISSRVVNLTIKPGLSRGSRLLEPKLCWVDVRNELDEGMSISLLGIHSIVTSLNPDEDDNPFFTITTERGEVHAFESPTLSERNHTVHGLRNVVAWLSYHLVMGNMATGTQIVSDLEEERGESSGELPSLKTPVQAMNDLSHAFLD